MPSLHFAWALIALWHSRLLDVATYVATLILVVLTFVATLGTGEHFLVDLIVAVPFAVTIQAICVTPLDDMRKRRWLVIALGSAFCALWIAFFRLDPSLIVRITTPAFSWFATIVTVAVSIYLFRLLNSCTPDVGLATRRTALQFDGTKQR
jgi:hypothetical protein